MSQSKLKKFVSNSLKWIETLGEGNYGTVNLFYHKQSEKYLVGKIFSASGNQETISKEIAEAQKEVDILARINHENIIRVFGTTNWNGSFGIILEYACCKDLESLLMNNVDKHPISWQLRARFFSQLADALNYLHYQHDKKRSYIHGDLKPQNVLLGHMLNIKLADFGATTITKLTGATKGTIDKYQSTQHTPPYTAPEYLKNLDQGRCCSMDVYSYGMVGYEILTRKAIFSGSNVNYDLLMHMIKTEGQKPNTTLIDEIARYMEKGSFEATIFQELKEIVFHCWETKPEDRPKISQVKERVDQLVQTQKIHDEATDQEAMSLVKKLTSDRPSSEKPIEIKKIKYRKRRRKRKAKPGKELLAKPSINLTWLKIAIVGLLASAF